MSIEPRAINGRLTNPIGLGCMSLSWAYADRPSDADGIALLHRAIELGYDHFDTARLYGQGHNETIVGQALRGKRDKVYLASKMGIFASGERRGIDCKPATIREQLEVSLRLLQTDHIDLYYMHRRDFTVPIEESQGDGRPDSRRQNGCDRLVGNVRRYLAPRQRRASDCRDADRVFTVDTPG